MKRLRRFLPALLLVGFLGFAGSNLPTGGTEGTVPCAIYSGTVIGVHYGTVTLYHGLFCSVTTIYASRYYTCSVGEFYNGFTCPETGGGGGSW